MPLPFAVAATSGTHLFVVEGIPGPVCQLGAAKMVLMPPPLIALLFPLRMAVPELFVIEAVGLVAAVHAISLVTPVQVG